MTIFNQQWIGFDGTPVTGRVPTQARYFGPPGAVPSQQLLGEVAHAYKLFCDAVRNSAFPDGFHVQNRRYRDGSTSRMEAVSGTHTVTVQFSGGDDGEVLRGFVLRAIWPSGSPAEWPRSPALLRVVASAWKKWVRPYKPGDKVTTPTYFVDNQRLPALAQRVKSDQPYFDVYCAHNARLFKDALSAAALPDFGETSPIVIRETTNGPATVFMAGDNGFARLVLGTPANSFDTLFTRSTEIVVIVAGQTFVVGVEFTRATRILTYRVMNLTASGALQFWAARRTLLTTPPWASGPPVEFAQMGVPTPVTTSGGVTSSTRPDPALRFQVMDPEAYLLWAEYICSGAGPAAFTGKIYGGSLYTDQLENVIQYARDFPQSETVEIGEKTAECNRSVQIGNETLAAAPTWYPRSPLNVYADSVGTPPAGWHWLSTPSFGQSPYVIGGPTGINAHSEAYEDLTHGDTAHSDAKFGDLLLYVADTEHGITWLYGTGRDWTNLNPIPDNLNLGGAAGQLLARRNEITKDAQPIHTSVNSRVETFTVNASTKDYFYFDKAENAQGWVAASLASVAGGALQLVLTLRLSTPAGEFQSPIGTYSGAPNMNTRGPDDVNFGGANVFWTYVSPPRAVPVFAPIWQQQGLCPHIAYTTAGEHAAATPVSPRLVAAFRLQLVLTIRPPGSSPPTPEEGTRSFQPFMLEQMLDHWWAGGAASIFVPYLENRTLKLDAAAPAPPPPESLGLPGISTIAPHYYRT